MKFNVKLQQTTKRTCLIGMLFLSFFPISSFYGQSNTHELGLPYIRNYTPKEYGAHSQNWAIVQDQRGIIYVGNTNGILEYDGVSWRLIKPSGAAHIAFSLAVDENNRIYVGSFNELGYLAPDSIGQMMYVSLLDSLPQNYRQCAHVWYIHILNQSVYFMTPKYIFRYNKGRFKVWEANTKFRRSILLGQQYFVKQQNMGLMVLSDDSLYTVPGGEILKDTFVVTILPYNDENVLIGTFENGLYLYDGNTIVPFQVSTNRLIVDSKCAGGLTLVDSSIAFHSYKKGVIVLNRNGDLKTIITKSSGLINDFILSMFADTQNGLWLATNNGISRIEFPSPFSYYNEQSGIEGKVQKIFRHQSVLYAATSRGIFCLSPESIPDFASGKSQLTPAFKKIRGIDTQCWNLLSFGPRLLATTQRGIYEIVENDGIHIGPYHQNAFSLIRSQQDSNRIFLGLSNGLASIYYSERDINNSWIDEGRLDQFNERVRWLVEDDEGILWLCTSYNGVWRVAISKDTKTLGHIWDNTSVTQFDTSHGLPSVKYNHLFLVKGHTVFGTMNGVYSYDIDKQHFIPQTQFGLPSPENSWQVVCLAEGEKNDFWLLLHSSFFKLGIAIQQHDGTYQWFSQPFHRYAETKIASIFPDTNGICWFGGNNGIIRYDSKIKKDYSLEFSALIRRIIINGDSIVYAGAGTISDSLSHYEKKYPTLTYKNNALRFEYAATSFDVNDANRFQYFLEGFDNGWSDWTRETTKDYTNLPEGLYHFKVKAQNVYKHISSEDIFTLEILPPWYRTVWAYLAYTLLFGAFFVMSVKWRSRHLVKEKIALEQLVTKRTEEVRVQAEKLKEMDKLKSRFFANISHEFRTPLTLIIDPLREMITDKFKGNLMSQYHVMLRNSQRLLRLINQLLDLSKLESGMMKLRAGNYELIPFLKNVVSLFESQAVRQKIRLRFRSEDVEAQIGLPVKLYFDREKLEQILSNLLSNAFKFTPEGGEVNIHLSFTKLLKFSKANVSEAISITVKDSGTGIPKVRLPYVFDRFYQVESSHEPMPKHLDYNSKDEHVFYDKSYPTEHEGTGIGLALTKELVELHHGELTVNSEPEKGTEFIIRLPMGKGHLLEGEIIEEHETAVQGQELPIKEVKDVDIEQSEIDSTVTDKQSDQDFDPSLAAPQKTLILVIEDNADVRAYIRQHLLPFYKVEQAKDGSQGVAVALETIPDLIISDVMMPNMDGYELCRILKKDIKTSHIPIILLTAKASDEYKIEGLETGADDYMIKPFNSEELLVRVKNLINLRRKLQEKYRRDLLLEPTEVTVESMENEFLRHACEIVEQHLSESEFSIELLARALFMSRANLHRKLRALTDQSPSLFTRSIRLKRAAQLLKQHGATITEIAFEVGFSSSAYFAKCFKEQYDLSPHQYQDIS